MLDIYKSVWFCTTKQQFFIEKINWIKILIQDDVSILETPIMRDEWLCPIWAIS